MFGIGAILVPSNPEFGVGEARFVLSHAGVSAVACDSSTLAVAREACQDLRPSPWFMQFDDGNCGVRNIFDLIAAFCPFPR